MKSHRDPCGSAPKVATLYFGGAGDDRSGIVRYFQETRPRKSGCAHRYFLHYQAHEALEYVAPLAAAGSAVILVGHSWGADTAARLAARMTTPVELLIGVDPVAKLASRLKRATARQRDTREVITVDGGHEINGWGDVVKTIGTVIGGGWPLVFDKPDVLIRTRHRHDDFAHMLSAPGETHSSALAYLEQAEDRLSAV
jgi:pimeloyl-ACP methyl ester carboxylesterase